MHVALFMFRLSTCSVINLVVVVVVVVVFFIQYKHVKAFLSMENQWKNVLLVFQFERKQEILY